MLRNRSNPKFFFSVSTIFALLAFTFIHISANTASAVQVTLAWDANSETDLAGYRAFLRQEDQNYNFYNPAWEGIATTCTIFDLDEGTPYYFVVRAYNTSGIESGNSNEVLYDLDLGTRVTANQLVLYSFEEGSGKRVYDVSGFGTPLDLIVEDEAAISWIAGGGLEINSSTVIKSAGAARKVIDAVKASNELTIESWITPANTTQSGPARIVTLSKDTGYRNFTLGQQSDAYDVRLRTTYTSDNGTPSLRTSNVVLTNQLTHVVYTRDVFGAIKLYMDGALVASGTEGGDCSVWDNYYALALANELTGDRPWLGTYYMVAIFDRAINQAEVNQNFAAGPGLN